MAELSKNLDVPREKNFIKENILCAKRSHRAEPKQRFVDSRFGDTHELKKSGLLPIYVHKKNYGSIPKFVKRDVKVDVKPTETIEYDCNGVPKIPAYRYIDKEERKMLLDGMKQTWEELMKRFRGLPFLTDTLPKAQKKAKLEYELQQLEKDIANIEQHPHIYVYDDSDA
ncbi:hypothetical protein DMN91_005647 [Ooceraea biroi]|uniref:Enkurin n=2 Tax=Ooceraea biroi TaxID=2015173 RepID=A0A026X379_OOCBI|nr:Enkurin [Ooceraea biroi]RLU21274.1 hypothetical protein DMN91_005647 [Ooceraea biroi]